MKIPQEIIELSVNGGWNSKNSIINAKIALDPTFWQSLGRALGWRSYAPKSFGVNDGRSLEPTYMDYAHRFYDLILQGKDPAPFWEELLSGKQ